MAARPPAAERARLGCKRPAGPCRAEMGGRRVCRMAAPPGPGLPSTRGLPAGGRRSLAGRAARSAACSEPGSAACSAREAEDILHGAGAQSCLPASTGKPEEQLDLHR